MSTLPIILSSRDPAAKDIIALIGEHSSAKEVIIAVQEATERLESTMSKRLDDIDDEDDDDVEEKYLAPSSQLVSLVSLYSTCKVYLERPSWLVLSDSSTAIPRLTLRKKTASETLSPLLTQLKSVIHAAGGQCTRDEGRDVIRGVSRLIRNVLAWVRKSSHAKKDELSTCIVRILLLILVRY